MRPLTPTHGWTVDAAGKDIAQLNKWNRMKRFRGSRLAEAIARTCFLCYQHCGLLLSGLREGCRCRQWAILHLVENTRVRLRESRRTVNRMTNRQLDLSGASGGIGADGREGVMRNAFNTKLIKTLGQVSRKSNDGAGKTFMSLRTRIKTKRMVSKMSKVLKQVTTSGSGPDHLKRIPSWT